MEAKELMVGNYVYPFDDIDYVDNSTVLKDCIQICVKDLENTNNLFPIPIIEEWLLKFGFEKKSQGQYYISRYKELGHEFGDFSISIYDDTQIKAWRANKYIGVISCAYVHQLQNLYFALTGEELTIKEK